MGSRVKPESGIFPETPSSALLPLLVPTLDALRAQFAITGEMAETTIIQHLREFSRSEEQQH